MQNLPIGEILKEYGYITEEQIQQALQYQKSQTGKKMRFGTLLKEMGFVTETQVLEALGKNLDLHLVNLDEYDVDIEVVAKVPKQLAEKYNVIPVSKNDDRLQLVMSDPLNFYAQEDIHQIVEMPLEVLLCEEAKIKKAIENYYAEISTKQAAKKANISAEEIEVPQLTVDDADDDVPIINLINSLLVRGYSTNASDIHIEPCKTFTQVRMRVDGQLVSYLTLEKQLHNSIVARIKIMSNLNIAEKRIPQDGNFHVVLEGLEISIRVSLLPTTHGEKVVMRYLTTDTKIDNVGRFGMNDRNYMMLMKMMSAPNGIIYITGPTGSGKTTTLYMVLEYLSQRPVNISTIEDPVERDLSGINQTSVNVQAGMTFAVGLRALLRQDPDIIMIGETRDGETAEISVRSAITGHLVVSTLHTNDALSSIVRLEDMGVAPYLVANSVVGIVAQRLVRKVCTFCKEEVPVTPEDIAIIGTGIPTVCRGRGCKVCNNTGYKGRMSIHEMVYIDKKLKRMIANGANTDEMVEYARNNLGMKNLMENAIELVKEGVTTPEEIMKIAYYSD
ncbi:MAG: Flp pilus assembly complex ATPase component TadA [Ruminococcus sp.]|nr:Flp pilus assembly complex ATPase component TadA [Ruminococcus sp.]